MNGTASNKRLKTLACLLALLSTFTLTAFAQGTRGTISGKVTDPNGAVISGATVKLIDVAKGQALRTVQTNAEGVFQIVEVEPALYDVAVTANGFAETRLKAVKVEPNRNVQFDATLNLGTANAEVTVNAGQELVDRESPTLGTTVDSRRVIGLPLNGRNVLGLALLQPGVIESNLNTTATFGQGIGIRVNGSRGVENNLTLDGANNNEVAVGGALNAQPRPDAVQEFRLLSSNFEAEFGRNTGSVINVVTKSGTSEFHGNARFFYRPTFLSAARFFDKAVPGSRPPTDDFRRRFERKEFGGNLGGPLWLPKAPGPFGSEKLRNRVFFFGDYEQRRQLIGATNVITGLPTADERRGLFTARLAANRLPIPLLDPATGQPFPVVSGSLTEAGSTVRQQIPLNRFSNNSIVNYYLGFLPPGDATGSATAGANQITDNSYFTTRGDVLATAKQTYNFSLNRFASVIDNPFAFGGATVPGFGSNDLSTAYNAVLRHTYVLSPTIVNSLLVAYGRNNQPGVAPQNTTTPREIGFSRQDFVADERFIGPPMIRLFDRGPAGGLLIGNSIQGPQARIWENFQVQDSISWARGNHRFKAGVDGTKYHGQSAFLFLNNTQLTFSRTVGGNTSGDDFADFLLGNPVFYQFGNSADRDFRQFAAAAFGQDTWRVRNGLTLSLGLRWEYTSPLTDLYNRVVYYRPGVTSQLLTSGQLKDVGGRSITVTPGGRAPVGPVFVGDPDPTSGSVIPAGGTSKDLNNWSPRIGIAWSPKFTSGFLQTLFGADATVIRTGYGMHYGAIIGDAVLQQNGAPGFGSIVTQVFGNGAGTLADPFAADPYPNFNGNGPTLANPLVAPRTLAAPFAAFPSFLPEPNLRTPYVHQYNLTIERSFKRDYVLSLSYVGSRGRELYASREVNPGLGTFFPFPTGRTAPGGLVTNQNVNNRRLNDDVRASIPLTVSDARSWYDAFQAQVQKRFSNGLLFQTAYTFSKSLNEGDSQRAVLDVVDRRASKGRSADDSPHRLVVSWLYELPFANRLSGWKQSVLGGFGFGGIAAFQTGTPFSVGNPANTVGSEGIVSFADLGAALQLVDARKNERRAFNADAFRAITLPANGDLTNFFRRGTSGRNQFRAANGVNNFDLIVTKSTRLWSETTRLELRLEAFNAFNHTQFTNLDLNVNNIVRDANGAVDASRSSFGKFVAARESRVLQLAARFSF